MTSSDRRLRREPQDVGRVVATDGTAVSVALVERGNGP